MSAAKFDISVSVIIPVFRSADGLRELYGRLIHSLNGLVDVFEVLLIEDGGDDESWNIIQEIATMDRRFRGFRLSRNFGQHNALLAGIRAARHSVVVTMDDDLQHPPEEIGSLLAALLSGNDVVYGAPANRQHGFYRDVASKLTKAVLKRTMGVHAASNISAFRAFRTFLRDAFADFRNPNVNIDVLLTWATTKFDVVVVSHMPRKYGVSGYGARKLLRHAMNMMTGFSTMPLKLVGLIGVVFSLFGVVIFIYVIVSYILSGSPVQGFPFLASIIAIFSGAQLLALGILGEYLGRVHEKTLGRPAYLISELVDASEKGR